jgi:hypothetical protein
MQDTTVKEVRDPRTTRIIRAAMLAWRRFAQWARGVAAKTRVFSRKKRKAQPSSPAIPSELTPADDAFWDLNRPLDQRTLMLWQKQIDARKLSKK